MYPLSDNDMDRLSREAAEQFDVEQPTSGWDRLEKKLDKELPHEKERRRIFWFFLLLLLLGGGTLSLILINNGTEKTTLSQSKATPAQPETAPAKSPEAPTANANTGAALPARPQTSTASGNPQPAAATTAPAVTENRLAETPVASQQKNSIPSPVHTTQQTIRRRPVPAENRTLALNAASNRKNKKNPALQETDPVQDKTTTDNKAVVQNDLAATTTVAAGTAENNAQPVTKAEPAVVPVSDSAATKTPAVAAEPVVAEKTAKAPKTATPVFKQSKWAIGTTLGADWSRIHGTGDKRMGYNAGILISYNITDRFSISTGAIVTRKMYSALGKDFNPPQHYWTSYVKLESLDGYCQMIDIPLNIRYDLSVKGNNRWYASTGLSSYLMTSQFYNYYYYNNANQYTEKNWTNKANSEYWMGILNLSAGYERILNRKWSLQAEPFLKIPLKGVGFGNMDISSYGALFTLKYHPKF